MEKATVNVFNGENFHIWKYRMMHLLKKEGLWEHVEPKEDDEDIDFVNDDRKDKEKEKEKGAGADDRQGKRNAEKAHALIVLNVSDEQNSYIMNCTDA